MPITYRIDVVNRVVWSHAWGIVSDGELAEHLCQLGVDPRFRPESRQFFEIEGDVQHVTGDGIRQLVRLNPFGAGARRAAVAVGEAAFGLVRMYELRRDDSAQDVMMIFRDRAAALRWLGLPPTWEPPPAAPDDTIIDSSHP